MLANLEKLCCHRTYCCQGSRSLINHFFGGGEGNLLQKVQSSNNRTFNALLSRIYLLAERVYSVTMAACVKFFRLPQAQIKLPLCTEPHGGRRLWPRGAQREELGAPGWRGAGEEKQKGQGWLPPSLRPSPGLISGQSSHLSPRSCDEAHVEAGALSLSAGAAGPWSGAPLDKRPSTSVFFTGWSWGSDVELPTLCSGGPGVYRSRCHHGAFTSHWGQRTGIALPSEQGSTAQLVLLCAHIPVISRGTVFNPFLCAVL